MVMFKQPHLSNKWNPGLFHLVTVEMSKNLDFQNLKDKGGAFISIIFVFCHDIIIILGSCLISAIISGEKKSDFAKPFLGDTITGLNYHHPCNSVWKIFSATPRSFQWHTNIQRNCGLISSNPVKLLCLWL